MRTAILSSLPRLHLNGVYLRILGSLIHCKGQYWQRLWNFYTRRRPNFRYLHSISMTKSDCDRTGGWIHQFDTPWVKVHLWVTSQSPSCRGEKICRKNLYGSSMVSLPKPSSVPYLHFTVTAPLDFLKRGLWRGSTRCCDVDVALCRWWDPIIFSRQQDPKTFIRWMTGRMCDGGKK